MNFIITDDNDNQNFINNCEKIIENKINLWKPRELFVIRTKSTFDKEYAENPKENVFSYWTFREQLIISLFHPNMISSISIYNNSYKGYYVKCSNEEYIKKRKQREYRLFQSDDSKIKNYKFPPVENGLLIWYNENSLIYNEGTIMFFYTNGLHIKTVHLRMNGKINIFTKGKNGFCYGW